VLLTTVDDSRLVQTGLYLLFRSSVVQSANPFVFPRLWSKYKRMEDRETYWNMTVHYTKGTSSKPKAMYIVLFTRVVNF